MNIKKEVYQRHQFITVKNNADLEITFSSFGASIYCVKFKNKVITYHPDDYQTFFNSKKYCGKTLGRVCGRIKNAQMKINGKMYYLDKNEKNNTLHGGTSSLSFKDFDTVINENQDLVNVIFKYTSLDLEEGFPHEVKFVVMYAVAKNVNRFSIHYLATPTGPTPIDMSTHTYWRLLDKDVLDHKLMINADEITKFDSQLIVKGKTRVDKIFDFRHEKRIGDDIKVAAKKNRKANGYDCGYILNKSNQPQITLRNAGIKLKIKTDMDMVNIYTNCNKGNERMKSYGMDTLYGAIAIEPQMYRVLTKDLIATPKKPFDHYIAFALGEY